MRKMFMAILVVCLMGISFSFGHMWCEKHGGCCGKTPDKCLIKGCDCGDCKCCQDKCLQQKCCCTKDCTCGCASGKCCTCCDKK